MGFFWKHMAKIGKDSNLEFKADKLSLHLTPIKHILYHKSWSEYFP